MHVFNNRVHNKSVKNCASDSIIVPPKTYCTKLNFFPFVTAQHILCSVLQDFLKFAMHCRWEVQGEVDEFFSKMVAAAEKTISEDKRGFTMQLKHVRYNVKHKHVIYRFVLRK